MSYFFHDCVEQILLLFFPLGLVRTNGLKQYLSHFHLKTSTVWDQALSLFLSTADVPLLFSRQPEGLFFPGPLQMLDGTTHRGNADLDACFGFPGGTMLL